MSFNSVKSLEFDKMPFRFVENLLGAQFVLHLPPTLIKPDIILAQLVDFIFHVVPPPLIGSHRHKNHIFQKFLTLSRDVFISKTKSLNQMGKTGIPCLSEFEIQLTLTCDDLD